MPRRKLIIGLTLIDVAIVIVTVHFFLPHPSIVMYQNAVEHYINGREWGNAFVVAGVCAILTTAIVFMFGREE